MLPILGLYWIDRVLSTSSILNRIYVIAFYCAVTVCFNPAHGYNTGYTNKTYLLTY